MDKPILIYIKNKIIRNLNLLKKEYSNSYIFNLLSEKKIIMKRN